jgi:hypothetical protein
MMDEEPESKRFEFAKMQLIEYLLDEYQIDFIRSENEKEGKGYKKATPEESITVSTERMNRKVQNAARKQAKIISTVDRAELSDDMKNRHDRHFIRNGMLIAFLNKTARRLPTSSVKIDVPKLTK